MADDTDLADDRRKRRHGGRLRRIALVGAGAMALVLGGIWGARERIAADLIDRQLAALGLPMRYHISSIGLGREVLDAVVVGDPARPDLTVDRIEVVLRYGLGGPVIDRIVLDHARLYGRLTGGHLHFGALDRVIYAPSAAALRLPDWALGLNDARARIDSSYGPLALSADGRGRLSDGFAGTLGMVMPQAEWGTCQAARTTVFGHVTTHGGKPRFAGPLRAEGLRCGDTRLAQGRADLVIAGDPALANWTLDGRIALGRIDSGTRVSLAATSGEAGLRWQTGQGDLSGRITLDLRGLAAPQVRLDQARFDGVIHARQGQAALDLRGDLDGRGLARGPGALTAIERARSNVRGTPLGPLLDRAAQALARQEAGSRVSGSAGLHVDPAGWRLAVPTLLVRGGHGGQTLARLDQWAMIGGDGHIPRLAGNFGTGGPGLPAITGTMTAGGPHGAQFRLAMAAYAAGGASLAVPGLIVTQGDQGALDFAGTLALSGPIGQGRIDTLVMPVDGALAGNGRLALLRHCITPTFARARSDAIDLAHGSVTLCPVGGAIVRTTADGVKLAATMPGLTMRGTAADLPVVLHTGPGRITWPGTSTLAALDMTMGRGTGADHVHLDSASLDAGQGPAGGSFAGGDAVLAALPARLSAAGGAWQWNGGRLTVTGGTMLISDAASPARFAPVGARAAAITWAQGAVTASARLIAPRGGDELAQVTLRHDLASGKGHADVAIAGVTFRTPDAKHRQPGLQPADLSDLTKGIAALANGTIRGSARFDWDSAAADGGVTGTGRFSSDDLDFAGVLGPVDGLSGTIEFTDLIHLVTAPHQHLKLASINPGIEVDNGEIDLDLHPGQVVRLNRARWPFEGGTIDLEPTELHFGVAEPRRFTVIVTGLEAGRFLQHMNMANLSATGMFDGRLPLVFDGNGGRIVGGQLISRAPGGNVSYVGALSYRDLSPMANYAFKMLRSVDYHHMTIGLEGDLAGEVVTKVSFGGISQGQGAERNLITRQLARLPIRFDVNVRTQFYQLISTLRSLYDTSLIPDPRDKGLIDAQGRPLHRHGAVSVGLPPSTIQPIPTIQHQASGTLP